MNQDFSIIGGGIGGLTTGLFLKKAGLNYTIFESAPEIKPVGAGIIIANNAMQVYQKLGIHKKIEEAGNRISFMKITDHQLKAMSVIDLARYEKKYGLHNVAIHRGALQEILANENGYENISLNKRLKQVSDNQSIHLKFEDQSEADTKYLIAADGIHSVVRQQIVNQSVTRDAQQNCWRGIAQMNLPAQYKHELNEAWGNGKRIGFVQIADNKVYWYALLNKSIKVENNESIIDYFSDFHEVIKEVLYNTPKDKIILSEIHDLSPIKNWVNGNICLLGDAAHATTPNLGQGACQAIEDAYVLGTLLTQNSNVQEAFQQYNQLRISKAHLVVNTSWKIGKMAHIDSKLGIWFRNTIMKMIPASGNHKNVNKVF